MLVPRDSTVIPRRPVGRPSKAQPFRTMLRDWLAETPDVRSSELLERAKDAGYAGAKSAFYALVQEIRPLHAGVAPRFAEQPGGLSHHDVATVFVRFLDGRVRRIWFLVSRLEYSRWCAVSTLSDDSPAALVQALAGHFAMMGGVPQVALFDYPRASVARRSKGGVDWDPALARAAAALGIELDLCSGRGRQPLCCGDDVATGVRQRFFKALTFRDDTDVARRLRFWLAELNAEVANGRDGVSPADRLAVEQPSLRPLQVDPATRMIRLPD